MRNKQTAVEWLEEQFIWNELMPKWIYDYFQQAKQMEKEQIINAFDEGFKYDIHEGGKKYYNETYGKDNG
jgi:hypothetical protein